MHGVVLEVAFMTFDWQSFRARHERLVVALMALKRLRIRVAIIVVPLCVIDQIYFREAPFDLDQLNSWVVIGFVSIVGGTLIRAAALGQIVKREALATSGAYSMCRHPLYLGSLLIALGFCILLRDLSTDLIVASYFLTFYPLTIAWEEIELEKRYGEAHRAYCACVPLLLPLGRLQWNGWSWRCAIRNGGFAMLLTEGVVLVGIEVMAEVLR